jgi:hypothetical protein
MINTIENGGMNLQDITCKMESLKLKWIKKLTDDEFKSPWKAYLNSKFKENIEKVIHYNYTKDMYPNFRDAFYNDMFTMWAKIHHTQPTDNEHICWQSLWNNANIKADGHCIYYKSWDSKNIRFIQDITGSNGLLLSKNDLVNKYSLTSKQLEYETLIHAIPKAWKSTLKKNKTLNLNYHIFIVYRVHIHGKYTNLDEISTRQLYLHLANQESLRPTSETKWNQKLDFIIDEPMWDIIYTNYQKIVKDTTLQNFQFKITHRILACNYNLQIWNIRDNNRCDICNEVDTAEHMLYLCNTTYSFWQKIFNWWAKNMKVWFEVGTYEIIFGIPNENDESIINQLNYFTIIAKYYVYRTKKADKALEVYEFLLDLKNRLAMKKLLVANDAEKKIMTRWNEIFEALHLC